MRLSYTGSLSVSSKLLSFECGSKPNGAPEPAQRSTFSAVAEPAIPDAATTVSARINDLGPLIVTPPF